MRFTVELRTDQEVCTFSLVWFTDEVVASLVLTVRLWPNYGLSGGLMKQGARARGKAAMVLVLLAKKCG